MVKRKSYIITLIIVILFCCSCSYKNPEVIYIDKPVYVNVPVLEIPKIKPIIKPNLPIYNITTKSQPNDIAEAYYNTIQILLKYTKLLEIALDPFYKEYSNGNKKINK